MVVYLNDRTQNAIMHMTIISTEVELSSPTKDLALPLTSATPSLSHVLVGTGVLSATHVKASFSPGEAVILLG